MNCLQLGFTAGKKRAHLGVEAWPLGTGPHHTQGIDKRRVESSLHAWGYAISGSDG